MDDLELVARAYEAEAAEADEARQKEFPWTWGAGFLSGQVDAFQQSALIARALVEHRRREREEAAAQAVAA